MIDYLAKGKDPYAVLAEYKKKYKKLFIEEAEIYQNTLEEGERIFKGYMNHWEDDGVEFVDSEVELKIELVEGVEFVVHIDKVAQEKGMLWLWDHKTHKNLPTAEQRLSDLQLVLYFWVWNKLHTGKRRVSGIVWDYLRTKTPTIPQLLKNGTLSRRDIITDHATYLATIREHNLDPDQYRDVLDELAKQKSPFYDRVPLPAPDKNLIESVVNDTIDTAIEIRGLGEILKDRNLTYMCPSCEFYEICHADLRGLDINFIMKTRYEEAEPYGSEESDD